MSKEKPNCEYLDAVYRSADFQPNGVDLRHHTWPRFRPSGNYFYRNYSADPLAVSQKAASSNQNDEEAAAADKGNQS